MQVGDKLWYVPNDQRHDRQREITVVKIGRKWATVEPSYFPKIDLETGLADGGGFSSRGRAYRSREAYEKEKRMDNLWSGIRSVLTHQYRRPDTVQLTAIIAELKVLLEEGQ